MKVGQIGPTFVVPGKTVIFLGVKSVVPSSKLKMTKSQKKISTCMRIHTRVYANTWWWGQICPPPELNRVKIWITVQYLNFNNVLFNWESAQPSAAWSRQVWHTFTHPKYISQSVSGRLPTWLMWLWWVWVPEIKLQDLLELTSLCKRQIMQTFVSPWI